MNAGTASAYVDTPPVDDGTITYAFLRDCLERTRAWWHELDEEYVALVAIPDPPDWGRLRQYLRDRYAAEREFRRLGQEPPRWP